MIQVKRICDMNREEKATQFKQATTHILIQKTK